MNENGDVGKKYGREKSDKQNNMISSRKTQIDYIKMIAIILVILQHTTAYCVENSNENTEIFQLVRYVCSIIDVPIFIICAGYLCHIKKLFDFYENRFFRILIPFYTFSGLKLLYANFVSNEYLHGSNLQEQLFNSFVIGNLYWFCYAISLIFLFAPLLWSKKNDKKVNIYGIILAIGCLIFTLLRLYFKLNVTDILQFRNAVYYYPFFAAGYIFKEYENIDISFINKIGQKLYIFICSCIFGVSLICLLRGKCGQFEIVFKLIASFACFLLLWEIFKKLSDLWIVRIFSKFSLQIMFIDAFYKAVLFSLIEQFLSISFFSLCIVTILDIILSLITCLIIERIPIIRTLVGIY